MPPDFDNIDITTVSLSADVPYPASERRGERRHMSMYRSAAFVTQGFQGLCLIRNISAGGLMGKVHVQLPISAPISIEILPGHPTTGQIVWTADRLVGIQFDERIDVMQVIHSSPEPDAVGLPRHMPRLSIPCRATLLVDNVYHHTVPVVDVSQGGVKVDADFLRLGEQVVVTIEGMEPIPGSVAWKSDGRMGIAFYFRVPFDTLAEWAVERQRLAGILDELIDGK